MDFWSHTGPGRWAPHLLASVAGALLVGGAALASQNPISPEDIARGYATRHVLVRFREEPRTGLATGSDLRTERQLAALAGLPPGARLEEPVVCSLTRRSRNARLGTGEALQGATHFYYLHLPAGMEPKECLASLRMNPHVEYCELDHVGQAFRTIPNDRGFSSQWHHSNQISASSRAVLYSPEAWDITQGSTNVLVAILDSGIDDRLRELQGRVLAGYNFVSNSFDTMDVTGHGTVVAGILAANANNYEAGVGIDWNCRLLPVKVIDDLNHVRESWVAQGVDYAVAQGAKVINFSGGTDDEGGITLGRAISNAVAQGVIFVCASGNSGAGILPFPASCSPAIAVGASDESDRRVSFSNYGPQLDLIAPGIYINTIHPSSDYPEDGFFASSSGTSYAAPMVSGVCSLLASVRPDLNQEQALTLLAAGAGDQLGDAPGRSSGDGTDTPGWDQYHGWGRLNAYFSLLLATTSIDQVNPLPDGRLELSWTSPINASTNQPYRVELATPLDGTWTRVTNGTFRYEGDRTWWTEPEPPPTASTDRFYRVRIALE